LCLKPGLQIDIWPHVNSFLGSAWLTVIESYFMKCVLYSMFQSSGDTRMGVTERIHWELAQYVVSVDV